jgi:hypothetical protein
MRTKSIALAVAITAMIGVAPAAAQQAIRIGLTMTYSGQFADPAAQMDNGIKLYVKQHGDLVCRVRTRGSAERPFANSCAVRLAARWRRR